MSAAGSPLTLSTSQTTLQSCALGAAFIVHSLTLINISGTAQTVTFERYIAAQNVTTTWTWTLAASTAPQAWPGRFDFAAGDTLSAAASTAGAVVVTNNERYSIPSATPIAQGFNPRGVYSPTVTYAVNDLSAYQDVSYVSMIAGNLGNTPSTSPSAWQPINATSVNTDGAVTAGHLAVFADGTGAVIQDGGPAQKRWIAIASGASSNPSVLTVNQKYAVDTSAAVTLPPLPPLSSCTPGDAVTIADVFNNSETNAITVPSSGSDTIEGAASPATLQRNSAAFTLIAWLEPGASGSPTTWRIAIGA